MPEKYKHGFWVWFCWESLIQRMKRKDNLAPYLRITILAVYSPSFLPLEKSKTIANNSWTGLFPTKPSWTQLAYYNPLTSSEILLFQSNLLCLWVFDIHTTYSLYSIISSLGVRITSLNPRTTRMSYMIVMYST